MFVWRTAYESYDTTHNLWVIRYASATWKQAWQRHIEIFLVDEWLIELYLHGPILVLVLHRKLIGSHFNLLKLSLYTATSVPSLQLYTLNWSYTPTMIVSLRVLQVRHDIGCSIGMQISFIPSLSQVLYDASKFCSNELRKRSTERSDRGRMRGQIRFLSIYLICPSSPPEIHLSATGCHLIEVTSDKWPSITVRYLNGFVEIIAFIT